MPDFPPDAIEDLVLPIRDLWLNDLDATSAAADWLWHGYLAAGATTLLTSPWKAGKTTLLAALLSWMRDGGTLAGGAVRPGKALVLSEESAAQWNGRRARFAFGPHVCWICRPFRGKPTAEQWRALVAHIDALHQRHGFALLVIDALAEFLPGRAENDAAAVLAALLPLQLLTSAGVAVLLLHHPRKQASADGQWARGSGALTGHVDIVIEMRYFSPASSDDRRRTLLAYSRYGETPRRRVIELSSTGTDYESLGDLADEEYRRGWSVLRLVLEQAAKKLTRTELHEAWPTEEAAPTAVTLWRWLERGVAEGTMLRDGKGERNEPYRYWLRGQEEKWAREPWGEAAQQAAMDTARRLMGGGW
jgi:hypothetical protein